VSIPVLDGHLRGDGSLAVPSLAGVDSRGAAPGSDAMADAFSGAGPATVRGRARRTSAPLPSSLRAANPSGGLKGYTQGNHCRLRPPRPVSGVGFLVCSDLLPTMGPTRGLIYSKASWMNFVTIG